MTPEESKATVETARRDLKTTVTLIAAATGKSLEETINLLELYYHVRRAYETIKEELSEDAEDAEDAKEAEPGQAQPAELSPSAKAAAFKRETLERIRKGMKGKKLSYPKLAEAAGVDEARIIRIMEGKTEKVDVYKKLAAGLDKLEN